MSIRAGYSLTNLRVTKIPFSEGLNRSFSDSKTVWNWVRTVDRLLPLTGLTAGPLLVRLFDKILWILFSSLVSDWLNLFSENEVSQLVWAVLSAFDFWGWTSGYLILLGILVALLIIDAKNGKLLPRSSGHLRRKQALYPFHDSESRGALRYTLLPQRSKAFLIVRFQIHRDNYWFASDHRGSTLPIWHTYC